MVRFFRKDGETDNRVGVTIPVGLNAAAGIEHELEKLKRIVSDTTDEGEKLKLHRNIAILKHCLEILEIEQFYHELRAYEIRAKAGQE